MRVLLRDRISPVSVFPGDTLSLLFNDEVLATYDIQESATYDEAIIFSLDERERVELGVSDGIGGIFARSQT